MNAVPQRGDPEGGRLGRVPGGVGEKVVQDLHDAPPVGQHPGQVRREVDLDGVPAAAIQERVPGLLHQAGQRRRLGGDRQRARLDAPRIQQVADQAAHVVGLLVDDPEELKHLGRLRRRRALQHGRGRALDRGQRGPQLVAHHAQELGPQPLQFLQRRQVLHGDDQGLHLTVLGMDRRGVDQRGDTPAIGNLEDDLFGAHRRGAVQRLRQGQFFQGDLPPVGTPPGQDLEQLLRRAARHSQPSDDPLRFPVERDQMAGPGIEDHHAHRRGVHQGFQAGPGPLLGPVRSGVGDRRRRLGREHRQDLFVLARELQLGLLPGQIEITDMPAAVPNRRSHEGPHRHEVVRKAERPDMGGQVPEPERFREPAEVFEELRPLGQLHQPLVLFRSQAGGDEVLELSRLIKGRDPAVAGAGQRAGALHNFMQNGIDIEALADAQTGLAQPGEALS